MKRYVSLAIFAIIGTSTIMAYAVVSSCTIMCFDPIKNADTLGFDPDFLKQDVVKQTCIDSHKDLKAVGMSDLNYCSKYLGTLP